MEEAILQSNGIKYLAPEIVLFYKSENINSKNQMDYDKTINNLSEKQKEWLKKSIIEKYSRNHMWIN
jgi:hypothetical protein